MELVANFGEIRTNHWHMGLDIRTQQRIGLPVYAAADGFISRVVVEPGGFGQAIYIDHPNGYTTLYAHLNAFMPALDQYVKQKQYELESWRVNLILPPNLFPVKKGTFIAYSGTTGGSQGPHIHFEIRDTKTGNVLNPLLFKFPIPDNVRPTISRLALYDRSKSTYDQSPQMLPLKNLGSYYSVQNLVKVGTRRISFAVDAVDRFTGTPNPNGIYSAEVFVDGKSISGFVLDDISYDDSRYINAQLDYPFKARKGGDLQHITPLPGAKHVAYHFTNDDGVIELNDDDPHDVVIEVKDAAGLKSTVRLRVQYDESLAKPYKPFEGERFLPLNLNIFETDDFELFTTEATVYDTINVSFKREENKTEGAVSPLFTFVGSHIPVHDNVTVRIRVQDVPEEFKNRVVIKNVSGTRVSVSRAVWKNDKVSAKFRQFGTYQAFIDAEPPTINNPPASLSKATRIVFTPKDNFDVIRSFRAELNGRWLRFTNDKGKNWIYTFDEHFPRGTHELTVTIEDEAGNVTTKTWTVTR